MALATGTGTGVERPLTSWAIGGPVAAAALAPFVPRALHRVLTPRSTFRLGT